MNLDELKTFQCPKCRRGSLELATPSTTGVRLMQGTLRCSGCSATYAVRAGIPRFVPDDQYAESFGFQWNRFRSTQLDSHTGRPLSADRLFRVTGWPKEMRGMRVLEAGSGAGRFTEVLLGTGARVFTFDLSSAVDANMATNGKAPNLNLFQASIYDIPLPREHFDKVMCLGVLQHTPDPERSFESLTGYVRPGGELAVDVYSRRWRSLVAWKYLLRPITKRMPQQVLFRWVERAVNLLLPASILLRRIGGKFCARVFPIVGYSQLVLADRLNWEGGNLHTLRIYSPAHDHPRSIAQVKRWFAAAKFVDVVVEYGPNGVVGRGRKPESAASAGGKSLA